MNENREGTERMANGETFHYTYSSKQQEEINRIKEQYIPKEENKMEQLRRLDAGTKKPGTIASLAVGVISSLVLGIGMCCTMVWTDFFVLGIVIGVAGIAGIGSAYPIYKSVTKRHKEKMAPQIMSLIEELQK